LFPQIERKGDPMARDGRWKMWRVTEPEPEYLRSRPRRARGVRHEASGAAQVRPEREGILLRRWWNV
jgi:hypothetical protein